MRKTMTRQEAGDQLLFALDNYINAAIEERRQQELERNVEQLREKATARREVITQSIRNNTQRVKHKGYSQVFMDDISKMG